jgi:hypothetical protein
MSAVRPDDAKMNVSNDNRTPEFADRIRSLTDVISHRCARTASERQASDRLRSQADARSGSRVLVEDARRRDKMLDDCPNAWVTTTFVAKELASALRIHLANRVGDYAPSLDLFANVLNPLLRRGRTIVDASRPVTALQFAQKMSEMPYIALRPAWMAAEYFEADFVVTTVVSEHRAFYQRAFGYDEWSEPRKCAGLNRNLTCMGLNFARARDQVEVKFPFLQSSKAEREALFRRWTAPRAVVAAV